MPIKVKCKILEEMIKKNKTPALFIGSGFSKRYLENFLTWNELLDSIAKRLNVDKFIISSKYQSYIKEGLSDGEAKQKIASFLEETLNKIIEDGKVDEIFTAEEKEIILKENYIPFKYLVKSIIGTDFKFKSTRSFLATELNYFSSLCEKLPCIITTNYDCLIEYLFKNKYQTYIRQSDYFYKSISPNAEIYKIHGCITDPNSIVITENDYTNFTNKSFLTIAKLLNILSTYPIIFIGYSLADRNIIKILESLISCLNEQQIKVLQKNLIFIERKESIATMYYNEKEIKLENKSLKLTYITTDNFTALFKYLNQFKAVVSPIEIRRFNSIFKRLILSNNEKLKTVVANIAEIDNIPQVNAIESIGIKESGYNKISKEEVTKCALYQDTSIYEPEQILNIWFSKYIPYNANVPLYFFEKYCKINKKEINDNIKEKLKNYKSNKKNLKISGFNKLYDIRKLKQELNKKTYDDLTKIKMLMHHYQESIIEIEECTDILKKIYENNKDVMDFPEFKKAVVIIDRDRAKY